MESPDHAKQADEEAEKVEAKVDQSPLTVFLKHAQLVQSLRVFIAKHEESPNEEIRDASKKAAEELKRIEKDNDTGKGYFALDDEKFRSGILKDINTKLDAFKTDVEIEERKDEFRAAKRDYMTLAANLKTRLKSDLDKEAEADKTFADADAKTKDAVDKLFKDTVEKQMGLVDKITLQVEALDENDKDALPKIQKLQKQLTKKEPELKTELASVYEDFKRGREAQIVLDIAKKFDAKEFTGYVIDRYNNAVKTIENDAKLRDTDKNMQLTQLGELKTKWLGDGSETNKGQLYTELGPFARTSDVNNRAYVLAEFNDAIDAVVQGKGKDKDGIKENTYKLMAVLGDTRLSKETRTLASLQEYSGEKRVEAASDKQKAPKASEAYEAFLYQQAVVNAIRTGKELPEKPKKSGGTAAA